MEPRRALGKSSTLEGLATFHLKLYGFWHFIVTRTTGKISWLFVLSCASIILVVTSYIIFQTIYVFRMNLKFEIDLKKMAFAYLNAAPCTQDFNKVIFFLAKMQEFCHIYDTLQEGFLKSIPKHKIPAAKDIYRRTARTSNLVCTYAYSSFFMTGIFWVIVPGYDTDDTSSGRKKVLNGWYPFRFSESPNYEVVYTSECLIIAFGGVWYRIIENAIFIPMICLAGHFDVLTYHIATLSKEDMVHVLGRNSTSRVDINLFLNAQLKRIMKDYTKLIRYSDKVNQTYNLVITFVLGLEICNLTRIALHLIFEEKDTMFVVKTGMSFFVQLIEVILIFYSSNLMGEGSYGIREALYCNEWYTADRKFATSQQLMMLRASVPLTLTALKMYPVNLETLLSIFQFIYSTAALLSKMK